MLCLTAGDKYSPIQGGSCLRRGYKYVAACGDKLVEVLRAKGPDVVVDVDHACLCETIDTIGLYGFRHNFDALGYTPNPPYETGYRQKAQGREAESGSGSGSAPEPGSRPGLSVMSSDQG